MRIAPGCVSSSLQVNTSLSRRCCLSWNSTFTCSEGAAVSNLFYLLYRQMLSSPPHFLYYLSVQCILRIFWAVRFTKVNVHGRKQHGCIFPQCCCQTQDTYLDLWGRDCCRYEVLVQPDANNRSWDHPTSSQDIDTLWSVKLVAFDWLFIKFFSHFH